MISHLPGKCLDMHASLGSGFVHSSVVLLYNLWETFGEKGATSRNTSV